MKTFRTTIFWLHRTAGTVAGVVVLMMSVTGVLLMYEKQMIAWADTRMYQAGPPSPGSPRLPVETLVARVRSARPDAVPATITLHADPKAPAAFNLGRDGMLYVNAYTGAMLGTGSPRVRGFFRGVTDWHRWLAMQGDRRQTGRAITGASNLLFLFLVSSGFNLWFPQTIAGGVSAGSAVLVYTGLALACRRFLAWRAEQSERRGGAAASDGERQSTAA
jgi:uncharacterized iron-regulated membrane protein